MTSSVKNSIPQFVWWITNHSLRAEQLVGDHERADRVVAGATAGVADHVRVAFAEPGVLRGVEAGVHAGEDREASGGRHRQLALVAEAVCVGLVRGKNLVEHSGHRSLLFRFGAGGVAWRLGRCRVGPGCAAHRRGFVAPPGAATPDLRLWRDHQVSGSSDARLRTAGPPTTATTPRSELVDHARDGTGRSCDRQHRRRLVPSGMQGSWWAREAVILGG